MDNRLGYNIRLIYSGEKTIEVYHYNRAILLGRTMNVEGRNTNGTGDKTNIKKTSIHRTRTKLARLINANEWNYFLTLTFATDLIDTDAISRMFRKMKRMYGEFKYVYVKELTKKGRLHYHILLNIDLGTIEDIREYERWFSKNVWEQGFVKLKPVHEQSALSGYLCKYLTKDLDLDAIEGRLYNSSRNLNKSEEVCIFDTKNIWEILQEMNLDIKYITSYCMKYEHRGEDIENQVIYIKGEYDANNSNN